LVSILTHVCAELWPLWPAPNADSQNSRRSTTAFSVTVPVPYCSISPKYSVGSYIITADSMLIVRSYNPVGQAQDVTAYRNCQLLWKTDTDWASQTIFLTSDESVVVVVASGRRIIGLNVKDGSTAWFGPIPDPSSVTSLLGLGPSNSVLFWSYSSATNHLVVSALDEHTGAGLWNQTLFIPASFSTSIIGVVSKDLLSNCSYLVAVPSPTYASLACVHGLGSVLWTSWLPFAQPAIAMSSQDLIVVQGENGLAAFHGSSRAWICMECDGWYPVQPALNPTVCLLSTGDTVSSQHRASVVVCIRPHGALAWSYPLNGSKGKLALLADHLDRIIVTWLSADGMMTTMLDKDGHRLFEDLSGPANRVDNIAMGLNELYVLGTDQSDLPKIFQLKPFA